MTRGARQGEVGALLERGCASLEWSWALVETVKIYGSDLYDESDGGNELEAGDKRLETGR